MRSILLAFSLLVLSVKAADTPLSAVLIDGEGWTKVGRRDRLFTRTASYLVRKDKMGRYVVLKLSDSRVVAEAGPGETFGDAVLSPHGGILVVSVPSHHYLYAFQVKADGSLWAKEKTYTLRPEKLGKAGSDVGGMAFDTKGRLWVAMPGGVQYFDEEMRFSGQLSRPEGQPVEHVWFEGEKRDELYIVCGDQVWKRKVNATGAEE